jgi:excisionase family DNA binding protein
VSEIGGVIIETLRPELERLVDELIARRLREFRPPAPAPWMTTAEVAEYLGLSVAAVRQRAQRGTLPAVRDDPSNRWIFRRLELDAHFGRAGALVLESGSHQEL